MRVLVFTTTFPSAARPTHGVFVLERIRHLAHYAEIRVVAPVPWFQRAAVPRHAHRDGLPVLHPTFVYVPGLLKCLDGFFLFLSSFLTVARLRRAFRFDLIDAHFAFPDGFAAVLLGWWFRIPVTITLRGTLIPLSVYRLRRAAMQWTLRHATRVIAVAQPLADRARAFGVPSERIDVIPNGVDTRRFAPMNRVAARRRVGLRESGKVLVSVGHLSLRKGFHRVLRALPDIRRSYPDLTFAIVGGPGAERDCRPMLLRLIREHRLSDCVVLAGGRPHDELRLWLGAADVFVLASDYEGCPNVVWEAIACGRPVVATKVGDVQLMVPASVGLLINDPEERPSLARAITLALEQPWDPAVISRHAEDHTWAAVATQVLDVWRAATGGTRTAASAIRESPARMPVAAVSVGSGPERGNRLSPS